MVVALISPAEVSPEHALGAARGRDLSRLLVLGSAALRTSIIGDQHADQASYESAAREGEHWLERLMPLLVADHGPTYHGPVLA
jgi:hypothetical protein